MLVGIGLDEARIDRKALTTDEAGSDRRPDDTLEHTAENIAVAKALVARAWNAEWSGTLSSIESPQNQR